MGRVVFILNSEIPHCTNFKVYFGPKPGLVPETGPDRTEPEPDTSKNGPGLCWFKRWCGQIWESYHHLHLHLHSMYPYRNKLGIWDKQGRWQVVKSQSLSNCNTSNDFLNIDRKLLLEMIRCDLIRSTVLNIRISIYLLMFNEDFEVSQTGGEWL
uniref:Uncharacterized protein n=1 Tax=Lactuca sativa TaxID=4236 RepID=A0A9R1UD45_LACSA|nr:hypothetical protein LSAT_V11C900460350 [Lactuca sativa]